MRITNNLLSLNGTRNAGIINTNLNKAMEHLSSGYRINRSADDAAGLSISEKLRGRIRALNQASRNAQDGISLLQTADGALDEVHNMLTRMRELTTQASNGTYNDKDRQNIQDEINQLCQEIDKISNGTQFNQITLFNGSLETVKSTTSLIHGMELHVYPLVAENEFIAIQTASGSSTVGSYTELANILDSEIVPQAVNAILDTYSNAFSYLKDSSTGIGLKFENNGNSSALASVSLGTANGRYNASGGITYDLKFKLTVNLAYLKFSGTSLTDSSRQELESTILHEMTHAFMDESVTNGMLNANSAERYPLWFIEGMAQTTAGGYANYNDWVNAELGITETTTEQSISNIVTSSRNKLTNTSAASANYGTGYLACMYLGQLASGSSTITPSNIQHGLDSVLTKLISGKSLDTVINEATGGTYTGISDFQNRFGDSNSSKFIHDLTGVVGSGNGSLVGGDFKKTDLLPNAPASATVFDLNPNSSEVINRYPDEVTVLSGGSKNLTGKAPIASYSTSSGSGTGGTGGTGESSSIGGLALRIDDGDGELMIVSIDKMNCDTLGLTGLSVMSYDDATKAQNSILEATEKVSRIRSKIGAYQNRLEHAVNNLDNTSENTQAAESRIRDTDMAKGMVEFSKSQILLQAAQAMIAQSNQIPGRVLQLL